jgi:SAM-dependent methyltransferase
VVWGRIVGDMTNTIDISDHPPAVDHDWQCAGAAWGHAARDWACLFEHYATDAITVVLERLSIGNGQRLLDIACGSGLAIRRAGATGATVAGIDASAELVDIARIRNPGADVRIGSMFELPWHDATFDAAMSINGIWGGCDAAVREASRVLRPGGTLAITFWGSGPPLDLRPCFQVFARHSPTEHLGSMRRLNNIAKPGIAEHMLTSAGFEVATRIRRISTLEWPDADIAWRALASVGPAVPALRNGDIAALRRDVLDAIAPCRDEGGIYRFRNDHHIVIAHKPKEEPT